MAADNPSVALIQACEADDIETVNRLLAASPAPDLAYDTGNGSTPLHSAALVGSVECVTALLAAGADVDLADRDWDSTPLSAAVMCGYDDVVEVLLNAGANPSQVDRHGDSALSLAASGGEADIANALITAGAQLEHVNREGMSPLACAARRGNAATVKALLYAGACVENSAGSVAPLVAAARGQHAAHVAALIEGGADVNSGRAAGGTRAPSESPMSAAAKLGNLDIVQLLVEAGADLCASDGLVAAARGGHVHILNYLVERGANVNVVHAGYESPLMAACCVGQLDAIDMLLALGADPCAYLQFGNNSALEAAVISGSLAAVKKIVAAGAPIVCFERGVAPLWSAVRHGEHEILTYLATREGVDLEAVKTPSFAEWGGYGSSGVTVLFGAAVREDAAAAHTLVAAGSHVHATDSDGQSPIHHAICGSAAAVRELLYCGAEPLPRLVSTEDPYERQGAPLDESDWIPSSVDMRNAVVVQFVQQAADRAVIALAVEFVVGGDGW